MDRYRAILNTIDGEVVADMVKGVCAGYYLADDVDKRIAELEAQLSLYEEYNNMDGDGDWQPPHPIFLLAKENDTMKAQLEAVRSLQRYEVEPDMRDGNPPVCGTPDDEGDWVRFDELQQALNGEDDG